jgi:hypothetical protein
VVGFAALTWLVVVPPPGQVMPRWRLAGSLAAGFAALSVAAGLAVGSGPVALDAGRVLDRGGPCLKLGLFTALVPIFIAALLVRGSLPVGRRWAAAALGAAGGSLGGLVLEMHCPIDDRLHMGLVHGGVVVAAAVLAAVIASFPAASTRRRA